MQHKSEMYDQVPDKSIYIQLYQDLRFYTL